MDNALKEFWFLLKMTAERWWEDKVPRLGAALAFYSMLSIGPLLLIVTAIAGLVFGREAVTGRLAVQLESLVGKDAADMLQVVVANSYQQDTGLVAAMIGIGMLLFAASGVFAQLQDALNTIWGIKSQNRPFWYIFKDRFLSFTMVLGTGFLLMTSLAISAGLAAFGEMFFGRFETFATVLELLNFLISFSVITALFALIFKVLPDTHIQWRDVWLGAMLTAALFTIGKLLIGLYLGKSALSSTYGAAGSLVIILIWVYYSSQILFFGAEFTQVYSENRQQVIPPEPGHAYMNLRRPSDAIRYYPHSPKFTSLWIMGIGLLGLITYRREISAGFHLVQRMLRK